MTWRSVNEALTGSFPTSVESVITTALIDQSACGRTGTRRPAAQIRAAIDYLTCSVAFMVGWNVQV